MCRINRFTCHTRSLYLFLSKNESAKISKTLRRWAASAYVISCIVSLESAYLFPGPRSIANATFHCWFRPSPRDTPASASGTWLDCRIAITDVSASRHAPTVSCQNKYRSSFVEIQVQVFYFEAWRERRRLLGHFLGSNRILLAGSLVQVADQSVTKIDEYEEEEEEDDVRVYPIRQYSTKVSLVDQVGRTIDLDITACQIAFTRIISHGQVDRKDEEPNRWY